MRLARFLFLVFAGVPGLLHAACSASNGDAIPGEVRDAQALDVGSTIPPGLDGASSESDSGAPEDAASSDALSDADAPTSQSVRINEVYVDRMAGGSQVEYVELRGAEGLAVDDLFLRVVDKDGMPTPQAFAVGDPGDKIGATGTWVIGGALASGRVDQTITNAAGWGLDTVGAVQLLRGPARDVVDVVGWTTDPDGGFVTEPALPPKSTGEGKPYVLPSGGSGSFGRKAGAPDTNDNRADFCTMTKSGGNANAACE